MQIGDTNLKSFTVAFTVAYFHLLRQSPGFVEKYNEEQKN